MMEAARTSKTLVNFYQTTRRYNPEDSHLRTHRRENLKSYLIVSRLVRNFYAFYGPESSLQYSQESATELSHEPFEPSLHLKPCFTHPFKKLPCPHIRIGPPSCLHPSDFLPKIIQLISQYLCFLHALPNLSSLI
jgi:hypothetical protein